MTPLEPCIARPGAVAPRRRRRGGRAAVVAFLLATVLVNVGFAVGTERAFPGLRDPEYGRRLTRLEAQRRAHPDRPFAVVLGSSRTAMGVCPTDANAAAGPLAFNMGQVGAGPVMQLMTLRRLLAAGVTPEAVVVEFWPPFLREDRQYAEEGRIDKRRLLPQDEPVIRAYFDQDEQTLATMRRLRWNPVFEYRGRLVNQIDHRWLHLSQRFEHSFEHLDAWGWLPGHGRPVEPAVRAEIREVVWGYYRDLFEHYAIGPVAKRATHELLALCRARGVRAAFVWLPESRLFLDGCPPAVTEEAEAFLAEMRAAYSLPLIDGRTWVADDLIPDGFHLSQAGARAFSGRFGDAVRATFPDLTRGRP